MENNRLPHFTIPSDQITTKRITVRGRSVPVERPSYSAHGDYLRERASKIRESFEVAADGFEADSLFLQVRTPASLPIEKEKVRIANVGLQLVSVSSNDTSMATATISRDAFEKLREKLQIYATSPRNRGRTNFSVIEDLALVPASEKIAPELDDIGSGVVNCLLFFYSTLTESEKSRVLLALRSFLSGIKARLGSTRRFANGVVVVEAALTYEQIMQVSESFTTLRYVKPDTLFYVPDSWHLRSIPDDIAVTNPAGRTAVVLFDTGVSTSIRGIAGCVKKVIRRLPPGALAPRPAHGTFVASRISYGDELKNQVETGSLTPQVPLIDVPIFGIDEHGCDVNPNEGHIASAIESVVDQLPPNARVINLSFGTDTPISEDRVSLVASMLDHLANQRDILTVTSAGNMRNISLLQSFPASLVSNSYRVDAPADSLSAIVVGSIALREEPDTLSRAGSLSAFSRRGPGLMSEIKPDLVAHGGNCKGDGKPTDATGIYGLSSVNNALAVDAGTSFAAPLVSAMAAKLMDHYETAPAIMIRALLLHFTKSVLPPSVKLPVQYLVGRGEPDLEGAMWSTVHSATFMATGHLRASQHTFIPFLVPSCLTAGRGSRLCIRATVVINPKVNSDSPGEYSCCRLSLGLRKPKNESDYIEVGGSREESKTGRWSPVETGSWCFSRSITPGRWELKLRLWTRNVPSDYLQPYAAVIQVWDESGRAPILDEVRRSAASYVRISRVATAA